MDDPGKQEERNIEEWGELEVQEREGKEGIKRVWRRLKRKGKKVEDGGRA